MKTITLFFLLTLTVFAQEVVQWDDTTTASGKPARSVSQLYPLPVQIFGTSTIMQHADDSLIWCGDTLAGTTAADTLRKFSSTTIATLTAKFPTEWQLTITSDSAIQVSTSASFTSGLTFRVAAGESWTTKRMNSTSFPQLYIRKYLSTQGVTTWRADISGF